MKVNNKLEYCIQYSMCVAGGFIAAYAVLNHADFLASAQTANLINIALCITGSNWIELCLRLVAVLIYMAGLSVPVIVAKYTHINMKMFCIFIEISMIILLYFFTKRINTIIALYPVFFMTSIQWNSFPGVDGFASSSIFSTNNLRQFTISYVEYRCSKDKEHLKKTKFFGGVLLSYHAGVVFSYYMYKWFAMKGVIFCLIPLFMGMLLLLIESGFLKIVKKEIAAIKHNCNRQKLIRQCQAVLYGVKKGGH
ncbi:MAG: DUF1275 domain-containing protein [Lachnospiraceae bacterium]|nr:DUF1275 domain-containing protein [Lachnospiraceae bacterium]